jgi:hypothetical protein
VLRRIGLSPLIFHGAETRAYFDPQFACEMEFLTFYSRYPNPKFMKWVTELMAHAQGVPVIAGAALRPEILPRPPVPKPVSKPVAAQPWIFGWPNSKSAGAPANG